MKGILLTYRLFYRILSKYNVKVSKIPIGIPMGTDIEYIESLQPHYIAYCAVGTPNGVLLAVTIDKMMVQKENQTIIISRPVLALSEENISFTQHYQLILNPNLINS